ncbi:MAG: PQQ-dependent sugar dehydrogenase [Deltaproteobacteria bacterium]|nr:PQQ-dependent sugar dehydrogenase [Kofleriaceae bacterium]
MRSVSIGVASVIVLGAACSSNYAAGTPQIAPYCAPRRGTELALTLVTGGLDRPVGLAAPNGDPRLFVVEQLGRVRVIVDGELLAAPYLDLSDHVIAVGPEQGLLGLAFHPDFASNGRFVVHYTAEPDGDNVVAELVADPSANVATASERELLHLDREVNIHNGGSVVFGPDGYLYVSLGDGSHAVPADVFGAGQSRDSLMAKVLRLDLENGTPYGIPPDNPWAGGGGAPEMYAWGLRNPWRISVDPRTGDLYIGDVGQNTFEEINHVPAGQAGANFGWSVNEGPDCWVAPIGGGGPGACGDPVELRPPLVAIDRRVERACAAIGGHVYRGGCMPDMVGRYLYSDFCNGVVNAIVVEAGAVLEQQRHELDGILAGQITSFGVDGYGELYVTAVGGRIYRLELARDIEADTLAPDPRGGQ